MFWMRGVVHGASSHAMITGLTGLGLGLFRVVRRSGVRWFFPVLFFGLAITAHFCWNMFAGFFLITADSQAEKLLVSLPLAVVVLQLPFVTLILLVVAFVWRQEDRLIVDFLELEPEDIVSSDEAKKLVPARSRNYHLLKYLFKNGLVPWWRERCIHKNLISLAFVRWHNHQDGVPWSPDDDAEVLRLRARIRRLRARAEPGRTATSETPARR